MCWLSCYCSHSILWKGVLLCGIVVSPPLSLRGGLLALLFTSYWGYRAYQSHVEYKQFMSEAISFQQSLVKDSQPGVDSTGSHNRQRGDNAVSSTSGLATDQIGRENTHGSDFSKKPVKVKIMPPEMVAKYMDGDPHGAIRLGNLSELPPNFAPGTYTNDQLVSQWIELPDGKLVKVLVSPGLEFQEGERVSPQYIENMRDKRVNYIAMDGEKIAMAGKKYDIPIAMDGERYDIPIDPEQVRDDRKILWAQTLSVSMEEIERLIANRELIVKPHGEAMTPEERGINFNLIRIYRPDLAKSASSEEMHQFSEVREIELSGSDGASYTKQSPLSESVEQGRAQRQSPVQSERPTMSSPETESRYGLSPERFDKARQLIDQYGSEEGLRRLREMDPKAARQFERERKPPPARDESEVQ